MKLNHSAKCSSCRRGENDVPADCYAEGKDGYNKPFRGYLCEPHLCAMEEDGAVLRIRCLRGSVNLREETA